MPINTMIVILLVVFMMTIYDADFCGDKDDRDNNFDDCDDYDDHDEEEE